MKILIAGEGGQGVQTIAQILAEVVNNQGYNVIYMPHYGVEMRMGISLAYFQISPISHLKSLSRFILSKIKEVQSKHYISYPKFTKADILVVMTSRDLKIAKSFIGKDTKIINALEFTKIADIYKINHHSINMIVLGIIIKELRIRNYELGINLFNTAIKQRFKGKELLEEDLKALEVGWRLDEKLYSKSLNKIRSRKFAPIMAKDSQKTVVRFPNLCKGCGLCIEKCPQGALKFGSGLNFLSTAVPEVDLDQCIACQICEHICPDSAIKVIKMR